jgi:hypothetical protein
MEDGAAHAAGPGTEHRMLDPFVGRWRTRGQVRATADAPAVEIEGTDSYEWLPGGWFLLHRVDVRIGGAPARGLEVIGWDAAAGSYFMHSYDDHGNTGTMRMSVADGVWRFVGDAERFTGGFTDRDTLSGHWERRDGAEWIPWMDIHLTKSAD